MTNPFTQVYDALWDLAEEATYLTSLVKVANRIKFNTDLNRDPIKREISTADLPELVLVSTGFDANIHNTSSSSRCTRNYEWIISTGDMVIVNKLLLVEWALFAAMSNWQAVLGPLTWKGQTFVKKVDVNTVDNGLTDPDRNRGIRGWSALWRCSVEMHFGTQDLIASRLTTTPEPTTTQEPTTTTTTQEPTTPAP